MNKLVKTVVIVCLSGLAFLCLAPTSSINQYYGTFTGGLVGTKDSNLNGYSLTNGNTISATNINAQSLKIGDLTVTNASITTLAPTSNQTNYTVTLSSLPNVAVIHLANTNVFLTFANTNQSGYQCTVALRAITNSITVTWAVNLPGMATNLNTIYYVTNGTVRFVNFYNLDTTGTNVVVSDAGTANHT